MDSAQQSSLSLTAVCEQFYLDCEARNLSPRTVGYYQEKLPVFVNWLASEGITKAGQLQPEHIRKFIVRRQKEGLSPYTVHGFARCIKTLSFFMVREGIISTSPMAVVKMPKLPSDPLPPFTAKDIQDLLKACTNDRDKALVLTLLDSGVRASECCELNVSDLDMKTGALTVRLGKGRKSRVTFVGAKTRLALNKYLGSRSNTTPGAPLFGSLRDESRLGYFGLRTIMQRLGKQSGVADVDAHRFRRTFALESLRAGMDVMRLSQMMGHGSLPVLQRYLALLSDDLAEAHREHGPVDALLKKGKGKQ